MKRTPLKRKPWKRKARKPLRKVSKNPTRRLLIRADRALQDFYRTKKLPCEVCGKQADVMHHIVEKSRCAALRFSEANLAALCNGCHFRHHRVGDPDVAATIVLKRGEAWYKRLQMLRRANVSLSKSFIETQLRRFAEAYEFVECETCRAKPGSPVLCAGCIKNRDTIFALTETKSQRLQ